MTTRERRKYVRIKRHFPTEIFNAKGKYETEGITENVSLGGALIKTKDWREFQVGDQAVVTFYLPPSFIDSDQAIGLRGNAVIRRIDDKIQGIALEFAENFRQFERIEKFESTERFKYKKISNYLSLISSLDFSEFVRLNPHGFLLEKVQSVLDSEAVFQLNTTSIDDPYVMQQLKQGAPDAVALEARVIEIKKTKADSAENTITIGRAIFNDVVIYNNMVSRSHAYLYAHPTSTACYLVDCGSKNGTLINGRPLTPYEKYQLADGDEVCLGPQTRIIYFSSTAFGNFLKGLKAAYPV